jgi:hypothetical protein
VRSPPVYPTASLGLQPPFTQAFSQTNLPKDGESQLISIEEHAKQKGHSFGSEHTAFPIGNIAHSSASEKLRTPSLSHCPMARRAEIRYRIRIRSRRHALIRIRADGFRPVVPPPRNLKPAVAFEVDSEIGTNPSLLRRRSTGGDCEVRRRFSFRDALLVGREALWTATQHGHTVAILPRAAKKAPILGCEPDFIVDSPGLWLHGSGRGFLTYWGQS